jgi:hypothetical protein
MVPPTAVLRSYRSQASRVAALLLGLLSGSEAGAGRARVTYGPIPDEIWSYMQGRSWHTELPCPKRNQLVLLRIPYLDFQGNTQIGSMIVAKNVAAKVIAAFQEIYDSGKFRIYRMALIDEYQGDDDKSMEANNTSAFNCRTTDRGAMSGNGGGYQPYSKSLPGGKRHIARGGESLRPAIQTQERYCWGHSQRRHREQSLRAARLALGRKLEKYRRLPAFLERWSLTVADVDRRA